jgi:hypothetical protein
MEERVKELERKVDIMKQSLLTLSEWMDSVDTIQEIDEGLFDSLNERVTRLEKLIVVDEV